MVLACLLSGMLFTASALRSLCIGATAQLLVIVKVVFLFIRSALNFLGVACKLFEIFYEVSLVEKNVFVINFG